MSGPAAPTGGADAHDSLRKVLGYVNAEVIHSACLRIPLTRDALDGNGLITDGGTRDQICDALVKLAVAADQSVR